MCVKLSPEDLNPGPCLPHSTNTYTCGVPIVPRECGGLCSPLQSKESKEKGNYRKIPNLHPKDFVWEISYQSWDVLDALLCTR